MLIEISKTSDTAYLYFFPKSDRSELISHPIDENVVLDYTKDGMLYGIELLSLNILDINSLKSLKTEYLESEE